MVERNAAIQGRSAAVVVMIAALFGCESGGGGSIHQADGTGGTPGVDASSTDSGLSSCPIQASLEPLDDGCMDAVCYAVIRMDYRTLAFHGRTSLGGPRNAIDANGALAVSDSVFISNIDYYSGSPTIAGPDAGLFYAFMEPSDFGGFALVGAETGGIVAAGGVMWAGRGDYWFPTQWKPVSDIFCGESAFTADITFINASDCQESQPPVTTATVDAALELALRTNVAAQFAANGPFSAYLYLYTPTVGACDPAVAEYVAVLSQTRGSG